MLENVRRPFAHAAHQDAEVALEQNDLGGFAGDVDGGIDRDADVGRMERGSVVDAIAQVAHRFARLFQGEDDLLFLIRFDLGKDVGLADSLDEGVVAERAQLGAGDNRRRCDPHLAANRRCHHAVVASDDLQRHAEVPQLRNRLVGVGFGRVGENQEAKKRHPLLVRLADAGRIHGSNGNTQYTQPLVAHLRKMAVDGRPLRATAPPPRRRRARRACSTPAPGPTPPW